jgi:multiple sugar transport system ATP-binding protein
MSDTTLDGVTKQFDAGGDAVTAVEDVSIDIRDGEFLVLVGPSGCGKSTTLRLVAGLETVTDGRIEIGDRVVNNVKPKDRNIAMVFQSYALYPQKTVRENLRFGLEMTTDLTDAEITERVESTAGMLDITELLDRRPKALSGGQQQRVALGRAIVRDPEVFLMDEPLSNLDAKLRTQMRTELQELHRELETATIYVTHDQTEAMTMGDRIAILDEGRLQQVGTPLECYYEPANEFVAGFIGSPSMNLLSGEYVDGAIDTPAFRYPVTDDQRSKLERELAASGVTLGIRPEDLLLTETPDPRTVEFEIQVVEPMGRENVLHLERNGVEVVATVSGEHVVEEGQQIRARIAADRVHAFDRRSGEAVFNRERSDERPPGVVGDGSYGDG